MSTLKRKLANKDESVAKKKVVTLKVKYESNINGVIEGITNQGLLTLPPFQTLDQPQVPGEGKLIDTKEESGCNKKMKMSQRG